MITDRTERDVARWRELHDKGWSAMSAAERTEWLGEMKGRYSYTDMNRVERAVKALSDRFVEEGFLAFPLSVKTDWSHESLPTRADMERYLDNVAKLRKLIAVYPTTPAAPTIKPRFTYALANDIEQILIDLDEIFTNIPKSRYYVGELYAGEV